MCVLHSSFEWHQQKLSEVGKIKKSKIELKKETVHQNNYSGLGTAVYGVENEIEK